MKQRWLVAVVGVPLLLAVLLICPPWATALLCAAIAGAAAYELLHVVGKNASKAAYVVTILAAVCQVINIYGTYQALALRLAGGTVPAAMWLKYITGLFASPFLLTVILFLFAVRSYGKQNALSFSTVAAGVVGGAIFPMMYSCIALLRIHGLYMLDENRLHVLMPFVVAFAGDSLAMYFGKWFGRKKMTPVSPNKTWAGFWGNLLGSALGMVALGVIGNRALGYGAGDLGRYLCTLALVGVIANLFGQLGDLSTSLIKREVGAKDYSRLLLTHGGVLDRFDSTLFIAPVIYFFMVSGRI